MFEFRPHDLGPDADHETRMDAFGAWFDADVDPSVGLSEIVLKLGENLERVIGPEKTGPALTALLETGAGTRSTWREAAEESSNHMEWPLGGRLVGLLCYALFGVSARPVEEIGETLALAGALLNDCPIADWLSESDAAPLLATVAAAQGRWNLDHRKGASPEALMHLGGVKLARIRNMISGASPDLPRDADGLVLHEPAAAWLAKRPVFLPTIWPEEAKGTGDAAVAPEALSAPVFVPVARDGSVFHPGVRRDSGYQIGAKGEERSIGDFDEALAALQSMAVARWRRPSEGGNWGIVSGTEWRRMERGELDALARRETADAAS